MDYLSRRITMKERIIEDPTECLQKRRKRRDPPDANSQQDAMSAADFNYLSLPSLFGGRPVGSRFESSMQDCMLESGAYVSYIAERMDPTSRLDPEGGLGEPKKSAPDEEIDFVDENTISDKSDNAFIRAYLRTIESGQPIRKRPAETLEIGGNDLKQALGLIKDKKRPPSAPAVPPAPKATKNKGSMLNPLCFANAPASPTSTTTGGGNTVAQSAGGSLRASDSDSIEAPQQKDCLMKDGFPVSPARRNTPRRLQSPRRTRSKSKSRARSRRSTTRRKTDFAPLDFNSTLESKSLEEMPPQENEEHIEVIFVEEAFKNHNELFQHEDSDVKLFSSPPHPSRDATTPNNDTSRISEGKEWEVSPSRLTSLRKKCLMDNKGTTTEEESTMRLDEREATNLQRNLSPQQSRQPASPLTQQDGQKQPNETGSIRSSSTSKGSKKGLVYSQSDDVPRKNAQKDGLQHALNEHNGSPMSRLVPSDERALRIQTTQETEQPEPIQHGNMALHASTDDAQQLSLGGSNLNATLTTQGSMLHKSNELVDIHQNASFSSNDEVNPSRRGSSKATGPMPLSPKQVQRKAREAPTPTVTNVKSQMELRIARSNDFPESETTRMQVSRDMFSVKSEGTRSKGSRNDPRTKARVNSLIAFVDYASPKNTNIFSPRANTKSLRSRYPGFFNQPNSNSQMDDDDQQMDQVGSKQNGTAWFIPANGNPGEGDIPKDDGNRKNARKPKEYPAFFIPTNGEEVKGACQGGNERAKSLPPLSPKTLSPKSHFSQDTKAVQKWRGAASVTQDINSIMDESGEHEDEDDNFTDTKIPFKGRSHSSKVVQDSSVADIQEENGIEVVDSRFGVCGSLPASITTQRTDQQGPDIGSSQSRQAVCESVPSSIPTQQSDQDSQRLNEACGSLLSSQPAQKPRDNFRPEDRVDQSTHANNVDQSPGLLPGQQLPEDDDHASNTSGSPVEGYFTCRDKDDSTYGEVSEHSGKAKTEATPSSGRPAPAEHESSSPPKSECRRATVKAQRNGAVSPLTVERSCSAWESRCGFESLGGLPRVIEIIQEEDLSSSEAKSEIKSTVALYPIQSSRSLFSMRESHQYDSGWDLSTIAHGSHLDSNSQTPKRISSSGHAATSEQEPIPREIATDVLSISIGTVQSCITSTTVLHDQDKKARDHLGKYSRGRTFSNAPYFHQSSVSAGSAVEGNKTKNPMNSKPPGRISLGDSDENKSQRISFLRNAIHSERTRIMERVSSLLPLPPGNAHDSDVERNMKCVMNDSGIVLFQPTINLYGSDSLPQGLEPEGSTMSRIRTKHGPEIINLTEAEENKKAADSRKAHDKYEMSSENTFTQKGYRVKLEPEEAILEAEEDHCSPSQSPGVPHGSRPNSKVRVTTVNSPETSQEEFSDFERKQVIAKTAPKTENLSSYEPGRVIGEIRFQTNKEQWTDILHRSENYTRRDPGLRNNGSGFQTSNHSSRVPINPADVIDCTDFEREFKKPSSTSVGNYHSDAPVTIAQAGKQSDKPPIMESANHGWYVGNDRAQGVAQETVASDFIAITPVDSHGSRAESSAQKKCPESNRHKFSHSCPPACHKTIDLVSDMGDICVKAGNQISERVHLPTDMGEFCAKTGHKIKEKLRHSFPAKQITGYRQSRRSRFIRDDDDDDDGMEAELRDLEESEQLLRRELEHVHRQAELRRFRLRQSHGKSTPPAVLFSDCLWGTSSKAPSTNRLLGQQLVANSFSTSHKSIDDDLTDYYFSREEDSTVTYASPQTSMETNPKPSLVPAVSRPLETAGLGLQQESESSDEHEVIFVEDSFMSTDSFSFGEVTRGTASRKYSKSKEKKSQHDLSHLSRAPSNSSRLDPAGDTLSRFGPDPTGVNISSFHLNSTPAASSSKGKSDPTEIISLLDLPILEDSPIQLGDAAMPIIVGSQDSGSTETPTHNVSRDKCDPPGSSPEYESRTTSLRRNASAATEVPRRPVPDRISVNSPNQQVRRYADPLPVSRCPVDEPLESIEVVVLENGRFPSTMEERKPTRESEAKRESKKKDGFSGKHKSTETSKSHTGGFAATDNSMHVRPTGGSDDVVATRPTVTFLLPGHESTHQSDGDTKSLSSTCGSEETPGKNQNVPVIDLKDFDESVLDTQSAASRPSTASAKSSLCSARFSAQESLTKGSRSQLSHFVDLSDTSESEIDMVVSGSVPERRGQKSGSVSTSSGSNSRMSRDTYKPAMKRLETIDGVSGAEPIVFLGPRSESPPPAGAFDRTSTFDTRDTDTCESLSSRVKRLIEKAKANKRETGHDTFESRSTLTFKIPESLSLPEDDDLAPVAAKEERSENSDFERAIEDNISPDFYAANRIPARVMLAQPASHDQGSLSTITLPPNIKKSRPRHLDMAYPDLMAITSGARRNQNFTHDRNEMLIHLSRADDESSVTMDFPDTLSQTFRNGQHTVAQSETPASSDLQRPKSPSRIQKLMKTGRRFIASKKANSYQKPPTNLNGRQTIQELQTALDDIWSVNAENTHTTTSRASRGSATDSVNFNYSLSPPESTAQEPQDPDTTISPTQQSIGTDISGKGDQINNKGNLMSKRLQRVRKLSRSFLPRAKHVQSENPNEEPMMASQAMHSLNDSGTNAAQNQSSTERQSLPTGDSFDTRVENVRRRVLEMRGSSQTDEGPCNEIFRRSPDAQTMPRQNNSLRPPLPLHHGDQ